MPAQELRFGPYRALGVLGRGGMGIVYEAERDDGQFRRRVAVKVIRTDGDPGLPARMLVERQILASLDHPGIAKLLDGGVTDDGRPFLVMERIEGRPIDVHCDERGLTVGARLELFLTVLDAVQHAHRNLIIHRDLKPSNILVTAAGRATLLDFGVAKLLDPALSADAKTSVTRTELMTPEYASPEQLRGAPLTTASDVYSLGAVLYGLLCGYPPYDGRAPFSGHPDPAPPSARAPAGLPEDLDAIVLKALRPEATQRYASVAAMAQDIEAFLDGRPVAARRGNRWYRLRKLVLRHRVAAVAVSLVIGGTLLGTGVALWQAGIAGRERDRARTALRYAEQTVAQSREVAAFLVELFRLGELNRADALTLEALLERGEQRAHALAGQPVLQASMLDAMGQIHVRLARYARAETLFTEAYALRRAALGTDHPDVAESMIHVGRALQRRGNTSEARRLYEEALRIRRATLAPTDARIAEALTQMPGFTSHVEQERSFREGLAIYAAAAGDIRNEIITMHRLSTNLRWQGRLDEALRMDRAALALARQRLGPDATATGKAMFHLADLVRDIEQDFDEAEQLFRAGLAIVERREGANTLSLMHGLVSLAHLLELKGEYAGAERQLRRALAVQLAATGPAHPQVAQLTVSVAQVLARQGHEREARRLAHESLAMLEATFGRDHHRYADGLGDLALVYARLGDWDRAITVQRALVDDERADVWSIGQQGELHRRLGRYLMGGGRRAEAEAALLRSLDLLRQHYGRDDHPNMDETRRVLHQLYSEWDRPWDAERYRVPRPRILAGEW